MRFMCVFVCPLAFDSLSRYMQAASVPVHISLALNIIILCFFLGTIISFHTELSILYIWGLRVCVLLLRRICVQRHTKREMERIAIRYWYVKYQKLFTLSLYDVIFFITDRFSFAPLSFSIRFSQQLIVPALLVFSFSFLVLFLYCTAFTSE